ncbi:hypothetical protein D3C71_1584850 [compost metagenome]
MLAEFLDGGAHEGQLAAAIIHVEDHLVVAVFVHLVGVLQRVQGTPDRLVRLGRMGAGGSHGQQQCGSNPFHEIPVKVWLESADCEGRQGATSNPGAGAL